MAEAYIIDAVRTAVGKRNGGLAGLHPVDLGAAALARAVRPQRRRSRRRHRRDRGLRRRRRRPGGQHRRGCPGWPRASRRRYPASPSTGSAARSQQAISFGAQAIMSGTADMIVAGGMQNMSQIPISSAMIVGEQFGFTSPTNESKSWLHRYGDQEISQFRGSELIAEKWDISARGDGAVRADQSPACAGGHSRRVLRERDHPGRGLRHRRGPRATRRWRRWRASRRSSRAVG